MSNGPFDIDVDTLGNLGPLRGLPLQKAPYSFPVVSQDEMETREAHTSADVFKTNPTMAVMMSSNTYCSMSRLQSRGFSAADQSVMRGSAWRPGAPLLNV